uniref:Uncharacterized protein n=1 Tax=Anguilla anguilla TaxID=7936 RepID=A0A0E9VDN8_ANGAN
MWLAADQESLAPANVTEPQAAIPATVKQVIRNFASCADRQLPASSMEM